MNIKSITTIALIGLLAVACDNTEELEATQTTKPVPTVEDTMPPSPEATPRRPDYADTTPSATAGNDSMRRPNPASPDTSYVSNFEGKELVGTNGEELGDVDRVVIDHTTGKKMLVIGLKGIIGTGLKEVLLPLDQVTLSPDGEKVVTNMTKQVLEALPDVDLGDFKEMTDKDY